MGDFYYIASDVTTPESFDLNIFFNNNATYPRKINIYFRLDNTNASKYTNACKKINKNNITLIHLTWENLFYLGTTTQRDTFNKFRLRYVELLKKNIQSTIINNYNNCNINPKPTSKCELKGVGTVTDITSASDIDYNFEFKNEIDINTIIQILNLLYDTIKAFHSTYFNVSITELFDINITATDFKQCNTKKQQTSPKCIQNLIYNNKQRQWAFIRCVEVLEEKQTYKTTYKTIFYSIVSKNEYIKNLYKSTLETYNILLKKKANTNALNIYKKDLQNYFTALNQKSNNINKLTDNIIDKFSEAKFYESETYRSLGAFLDIVKSATKLDTEFYLDSILDNYGFLIDNLLHESPCANIDLNVKLMRVAKYLERICKAGENIKNIENIENIKNIKNICKIINDIRKGTNTKSILQNQIVLLGVSLNNKNQTSEIENWFKCITSFVFTTFFTNIQNNKL